jgi:outer membrane lipopolysaccharide assembly protein LptE/RlpB
MKRMTAALFTLLVLNGCGYGLVGSGNVLDPSLHTINIPTFVNRTTRVEIEQRFTQAVADEFVSRGRMRLVTDPKTAQSVLRGSIDTFNINPVGFDQGRATQYEISITANIELVDRRGAEEKVIWKNDQYRFVENYRVDLLTTDAFDQETRAIREIAVRFAQSLVANLLEGF